MSDTAVLPAPEPTSAPHDVIRGDEVAELLGINRHHVHRLAARGVIPSWTVGSARRFSRRAILAWREAGGSAAAA